MIYVPPGCFKQLDPIPYSEKDQILTLIIDNFNNNQCSFIVHGKTHLAAARGSIDLVDVAHDQKGVCCSCSAISLSVYRRVEASG